MLTQQLGTALHALRMQCPDDSMLPMFFLYHVSSVTICSAVLLCLHLDHGSQLLLFQVAACLLHLTAWILVTCGGTRSESYRQIA